MSSSSPPMSEYIQHFVQTVIAVMMFPFHSFIDMDFSSIYLYIKHEVDMYPESNLFMEPPMMP